MTERKCPECKDCQIPGGLKVVTYGMSCWVKVVTKNCTPSKDGRIKPSDEKFRVSEAPFTQPKHFVRAMKKPTDLEKTTKAFVRHQMKGWHDLSRGAEAVLKVMTVWIGGSSQLKTPEKISSVRRKKKKKEG